MEPPARGGWVFRRIRLGTRSPAGQAGRGPGDPWEVGNQATSRVCSTQPLSARSESRRPRAMKARIGFDHYTIANRGFTAEATLEFARAHGFDGVQFTEPASIDRSLDPGRLRAFRARAEALGMYLEVGLPSPNPVRRSKELGAKSHRASWPSSWLHISTPSRSSAVLMRGFTSATAMTGSESTRPGTSSSPRASS